MVRSPLADISVSYPAVEKLIETEDFRVLNKNFSKMYEDLEALTKTKGGLGATKEAKKGMTGIERVMDLLEELLKLKYRLMNASETKKKAKEQKK